MTPQPLKSPSKGIPKIFKITHGQHKGATVPTEDEALSLLTPEDLAQGGYVWDSDTLAPEDGEIIWGQKPTIDGSTTAALHANINRARH